MSTACERTSLSLCVKDPYSFLIRFMRVLCVLTSLQSRQLTGGVNTDTLLIYFRLDKWPPKVENGCARHGCCSFLNGTYLSIWRKWKVCQGE